MCRQISKTVFFFFFFTQGLLAQQYMSLKPKEPIICYAKDIDQHTRIDAPELYKEWLRKGANGRTKTATFEVTYNGFSPEAQAAFQKAVDIWSTLITSSVPIKVYANWQALGNTVLGSAIWGSVHMNFNGAQRINTWYPVALAEKMAGEALNADTDPDIYANFSSSANWYYGLDGFPTAGKYDLVTVVLHELGHGLGMVDSYNVQNTFGTVGVQDTGRPIIYDLYLENGAGQNLYHDFATGTADLQTQLTSVNLFLNTPQAKAANSGLHAQIYAPTVFDGGSSIAHLNEFSFPALNINSLMTPQIGSAEANHNPGPIVLGAFADMGWTFTSIIHTDLKDTEDVVGPYTVKAVIASENQPEKDITLVYTDGGADVAVTMTATGVPHEFQATIPSTGNATTYGYYISVKDDSNRLFTRPGKLVTPAKADEQFYTTFHAGPDHKAPKITHSPKLFILNTDTELLIEAIITDNLGIAQAKVEYQINGLAQPDILMTQGTVDSLYTAVINMGTGLAIDDKIKYRVVAIDDALAANTVSSPLVDFHEVIVTGLAPTQDSYSNDFNNASTDFFGNGFSIATPSGFSDGALHSDHPYGEGNSFPNSILNLIYQLRVPIKVKTQEATVKFDEIVLVEPGDAGAAFGSENFFDYVVVEGSKDGGVTWTPLADGYDARDYTPWLNRYNSGTNGNNSTGEGDPSLYRPRTLNLLNKFTANDEVVIRFRLFSDPFASGWGWAIDNLRIQIDETAPEILHDHFDYVLPETTSLPLALKVTDLSGIKDLSIEYQVNDGTREVFDFPVDYNTELYTLNLDITTLAAGDKINYRIIAHDHTGNEGSLPVTGNITTVIFEPGTAVSQYVNDFNTATLSDFMGNFFSINKPADFLDNALHTDHDYSNGFGLDNTSNYSIILKTPVILDELNPYISFDEITIVEGHTAGAAFGTPAFNDYVIVEGSKDGGKTWLPFLDGYDAGSQLNWQAAFSNRSKGTSQLYKRRIIDMLASQNFAKTDEVLIRFRFYVNASINGWGWAIDNLSIQGLVTSVEETTSQPLAVYPNPTTDDINLMLESETPVSFQILNTQGQIMYQQDTEVFRNKIINVKNFSAGIYLIKATVNGKNLTRKFLKK